MTKEEKIDAFTMRLNGYTLQEIGDKYGLTRERIRQMFASITTESRISRKNYIYPNISDWMIDNNVSQYANHDLLLPYRKKISVICIYQPHVRTHKNAL